MRNPFTSKEAEWLPHILYFLSFLEVGFGHLGVDFFPSFVEQLAFLGLFFDQGLGFGRVLGKLVHFPILGLLPDDFHVPYAEGRLMAPRDLVAALGDGSP